MKPSEIITKTLIQDGGLFNPDREIVIEYPIWETEGNDEPQNIR